jgi:predicted hydrocarbon binding protein
LKPTRKKILGYHYSGKGRTFHIVARLSDVPGALSSVLELLRDRADLIGSISYGTEGGEAIWSAFVRPLVSTESEAGLKALVEKSPSAKEVIVRSSDRGLLADSFHSGIEYGNGRFGVILPLKGVSRMFNRLVDDFESGGETILMEEGTALGAASGQYLDDLLGAEELDWKVGALAGLYRSIGWGETSMRVEDPGASYVVSFADCFECVEGGKKRRQCGFLQGHLASTIGTMARKRFTAEETKCRLRGDQVCEFAVHAV